MAPITIATLTATYRKKLTAIPSATRRPNWCRQRSAIAMAPNTISSSSPSSARQPTKPNSSASMVKMKSVCFSGRKFRCAWVPCR